ncbi:MAG TPA: AmmeMemoRadiSam system protein A [Candidatus Cloacimonadota bacterium]|nr:AmmeMemoRadiSam system protein A [Candidatus Cloacimonadota bacterium]
MILSPSQQEELLAYTRAVIASRFGAPEPDLRTDPVYEIKRGLFVSLHLQGNLRGCIGYVEGHASLRKSVRDLALAAAFRDPRFPPLRAAELPELELEISVLGELIPISGPAEIQIGRDGLFIEHPRGSGLLLPQVATDWNWESAEFLRQVCRKAGLAKDAWQDQAATLYRFEAEVF